MRMGLLLSVAVLVATPAFAHKDDTGQSADPNKVVCKSQDVIGSHLQQEKQCMTVAQWAQYRRDEHSNMQNSHTEQQPGGH